MKRTGLACLILVALLGLSCTPAVVPRASMSEDSLGVLVTAVQGGILIENLSRVACILFVSSAEGEQDSELAAGESVTVTGITEPIRVSAVAA